MWKAVEGYEGLYEVSDKGEVQSMHSRPRIPDQLLVPDISMVGGPTVKLSKYSKQNVKYVSELVAEAFLGLCPDSRVVHHKDQDITNNDINNLEYVIFDPRGYFRLEI